MRKTHQKNKESSSLHDIVFLMAAGFFVLFMVAFFYVNPVAKLGKINKSAEFIITMSWPDNMTNDIDIWVRDPNGILVWFKTKSPFGSFVNLERDDVGIVNDTVTIGGQTIVIKQNEELVTIRGIHPGSYVVNIQYYRGTGQVPVTVKIEKLNPVIQRIFYTDDPLILLYAGQELTVVHFEVELDGSVTNISTEPPISLMTQNTELIGDRMEDVP